jgi:hypothetical protein
MDGTLIEQFIVVLALLASVLYVVARIVRRVRAVDPPCDTGNRSACAGCSQSSCASRDRGEG